MRRQLQTRISEHKNHIRRNTSTRSVITEHTCYILVWFWLEKCRDSGREKKF